MALHRSGILQHVHHVPLHDAGAFRDAPRRSRRSEIVRPWYSVDQGPNSGHHTCAYGVRCPYRRHLHFMERNLRRRRILPCL